MTAEVVNCHPLTNCRTTSLTAEGILAFLSCTGHQSLRISLDTEEDRR
jgi:Ala-tRNA(Pro) deacylase